jgi:uncharacterized RDD family membrane protein YckC
MSYALETNAPQDSTNYPSRAQQKNDNIWFKDKPHPWRRNFARVVDYVINGCTLAAVALLLVRVILLTEIFNEDYIHTLLALLVIFGMPTVIFFALCASLINAFLISRTGSSLGKWIFGIKVVNTTSESISFSTALRREWMIAMNAYCLYIPFISMISRIAEYRKLSKNGVTEWDKELNLTVLYRNMSVARYIFATIVLTLSYFVLLGIAPMALLSF